MNKKQLLTKITAAQMCFSTTSTFDENDTYYFNYGYLTALKQIAKESGIDYTDAENAGLKQAAEWIAVEKAKKDHYRPAWANSIL